MTLSVCCMTSDPMSRVAAILGLLRSAVDEIVVAADTRVEEADLAALAGVADRVFRFEYEPPVDRPRAWLATQCHGDHILWIDGDEIPSPGLVRALPELCAASDVAQVIFPRRWLFPDADHWLDEHPWWPDFQIRLCRNDEKSMWFGPTHEPLGITPPVRFVDAPLYHLSCIVSSIGERRAKARLYDEARPGLISPAGGPFNEVLLVPERYATIRPAAVPRDDRPWIEKVLGASSESGAGEVPDVTMTESEEINAVAPTRLFPPDAYSARIEVVERDLRMEAGQSRSILVRVHNDGVETWPWQGRHPIQIHLAYHWRSLDGSLLVHDGLRSDMPHTVRPGESLLMPATVAPPAEPGTYLLELDLVHENVRWFECSTTAEVLVAPRWRRHDPALSARRPALDSLARVETMAADAGVHGSDP